MASPGVPQWNIRCIAEVTGNLRMRMRYLLIVLFSSSFHFFSKDQKIDNITWKQDDAKIQLMSYNTLYARMKYWSRFICYLKQINFCFVDHAFDIKYVEIPIACIFMVEIRTGGHCKLSIFECFKFMRLLPRFSVSGAYPIAEPSVVRPPVCPSFCPSSTLFFQIEQISSVFIRYFLYLVWMCTTILPRNPWD